MLKAVLTNSANKKALHTFEGWENLPVLIITTHGAAKGNFKSVNRATAGTSIITQPNAGGSIVLTDLIITTDRVQGAKATIQFNDGTNIVIIAVAHVNDAPCNITIPFAGHWHGWKDARLEVLTVGNVNITVASGYFKVDSEHTQEFAEWDSLR